MSPHLQLVIETVIFSKTIASNGSLCTINHIDIQSKVIVNFKAEAYPLVVLFVCISSSNSYNNMLMYDIVKRTIQQCCIVVITSGKEVIPCGNVYIA